jgi:hypothetical protein
MEVIKKGRMAVPLKFIDFIIDVIPQVQSPNNENNIHTCSYAICLTMYELHRLIHHQMK